MFDYNDYANLLNILSRSTYQGLEEAEVAVRLKGKLQAGLQQVAEAQLEAQLKARKEQVNDAA